MNMFISILLQFFSLGKALGRMTNVMFGGDKIKSSFLQPLLALISRLHGSDDFRCEESALPRLARDRDKVI